jgi:Holliday junction resolvase RusA-like endonuclease
MSIASKQIRGPSCLRKLAGFYPRLVIDAVVNRIWRSSGKRVYRSPEYIAWAEAADRAVMANRQYPKHKINGPFEAYFFFEETRQGLDLDNRIKPVLDWLQSRSILLDDKHCRRLVAEWNDNVEGCVVALRERKS